MGKDSKHERKASKSEKKHTHHKSGKKERQYTENEASDSSLNKITELDYFIKLDEYRVWLKLFKSLALENITAEESRIIFKDEFVPQFNSGKLPKIYYNGIPTEIINECKRSKHVWNVKLSEKEKDELATTSDEVETITGANKEDIWKKKMYIKHPTDNDTHMNNSYYGPGDKEEETIHLNNNKQYDHVKGKQYQRQLGEYLDELAPKEMDGRERNIDKRSERNYQTQSRSSSSRDLEDMNEGDLYGSSSNEYNKMKVNSYKQREVRDQIVVDKSREYVRKESVVISQFKQQLEGNNSAHSRASVPPRIT